MTCAFTGHRPQKLPWGSREEDPRCRALKRLLDEAVAQAAERGFRTFLCGMALGCDTYFAEAVLKRRDADPSLRLEAVLPCPEQADTWPAAERQRYRALVSACDDETMVAQRYTAGCMQRRNRYLVDHSALLIAAYDGSAGGTRNTIQYALSQGLQIADLPIPTEFPETV